MTNLQRKAIKRKAMENAEQARNYYALGDDELGNWYEGRVSGLRLACLWLEESEADVEVTKWIGDLLDGLHE